MTLKELDNLVKINDLKTEPPDQDEFNNMVNSAKRCFGKVIAPDVVNKLLK